MAPRTSFGRRFARTQNDCDRTPSGGVVNMDRKEAALAHAEASEKVRANPHLTEAIKHLKVAIDESKQGHADVATTHAEAALNHLRQVM
jgi:Small metal-binding protein